MAELGIAMDGRAPIADIAAQAQAAETGGATTLWIACHLFLRDPVTTAALALAATRKIKIALMALSPYSTHPVYIAMAAASLDEMADFHGQMFAVEGRRLVNGGRTIPIVLAASRPNMLRLAGRQADGVLISAATSPPFVKTCLDVVGAGRKSCIVYTRLGA